MESVDGRVSRYMDDVEESARQSFLPKNGNVTIIPIENDNKVQPLRIESEEKSGRQCYFADGIRRVDYVLAYALEEEESGLDFLKTALDISVSEKIKERKKKDDMKRDHFQKMLQRQGLQLEFVDAKYSKTRFVLIHAPWEVLAKRAEYLRFKMPIRPNDVGTDDKGCIDKILDNIAILKIAKEYDMKKPDYFTALFSAERVDQFIIPPDKDRNKFFTSAQRSRIVYDLLIRTMYDSHSKESFGIEQLLDSSTYTAAFPLHEGDYKIPALLKKTRVKEDGQTVFVKDNDRQVLFETWARASQFYKYQPLPLIKDYFGEKIGLYFAFLGFFLKMLFPAAFFGLITIIYGLLSRSTDQISNELCNVTGIGGIIMCPNCDKLCNFWKLADSCNYAKLTHVFDNFLTVIFAILMSVWATLFLEGWKRHHAVLAWEWDLMDYQVEEETIRPEYQHKVSGKVINPVTQEEEKHLPVEQKVARVAVSGVSVVLFLMLVLAFVFGTIMYRIIVYFVLSTSENRFSKSNAPLITGVTAAIINLICCIILSLAYRNLARRLTNWECPRTQTEWDNSYTLKVYLFEFVNWYSSFFYVAFIKGKLVGVPGSKDDDREQGKYRVFGYRLESCDPAGCIVDLVIELFVIMLGRLFLDGFFEIAVPIFLNAYRNWSHKLPGTARQKLRRLKERVERKKMKLDKTVSRWERDYDLNAVTDTFLFEEYLELMLQFGFVTLFVAAFPLAPLMALITNVAEIRLDAYKFLVVNRRPMPARAENLGVWLPILDGISKLSVLSNACVIAFTSDFVPKMLYVLYDGNGSFANYVNDSLSYYNATKLDIERDEIYSNVTVCRFRDYRKPPCSLKSVIPELADVADCDDLYGFSLQWWHVFAAKVTFVLIFEHVVFLIKAFFAYVIPDLPEHIFIKLQREEYIAQEARRDYELRPKTNAPGVNATKAAISAKTKYKAFRDEAQDVLMPCPLDQDDCIAMQDFNTGPRSRSGTPSNSTDSYHTAVGTNTDMMFAKNPLQKIRYRPWRTNY